MSQSRSSDKSSSAGGADAMRVELDLVRELAALLDETNLSEIEVHDGDRAVRVARQLATTVAASAVPPAAPAASEATGAAGPAPAPLSEHPGLVRSPMVGTAYLAAEPGVPPFVSEGSVVKQGDTLLIVEAMKVMNPITAPRGGKVKAVLVTNEQPVEFDQPLVIVE